MKIITLLWIYTYGQKKKNFNLMLNQTVFSVHV